MNNVGPGSGLKTIFFVFDSADQCMLSGEAWALQELSKDIGEALC